MEYTKLVEKLPLCEGSLCEMVRAKVSRTIQEKELEDKQKELEKTNEKYLRAVRSLLKLKKGEELTTELVDALVEKIYLYPGKRIEVQFRYVNGMLEGVVG